MSKYTFKNNDITDKYENVFKKTGVILVLNDKKFIIFKHNSKNIDIENSLLFMNLDFLIYDFKKFCNNIYSDDCNIELIFNNSKVYNKNNTLKLLKLLSVLVNLKDILSKNKNYNIIFNRLIYDLSKKINTKNILNNSKFKTIIDLFLYTFYITEEFIIFSSSKYNFIIFQKINDKFVYMTIDQLNSKSFIKFIELINLNLYYNYPILFQKINKLFDTINMELPFKCFKIYKLKVFGDIVYFTNYYSKYYLNYNNDISNVSKNDIDIILDNEINNIKTLIINKTNEYLIIISELDKFKEYI